MADVNEALDLAETLFEAAAIATSIPDVPPDLSEWRILADAALQILGEQQIYVDSIPTRQRLIRAQADLLWWRECLGNLERRRRQGIVVGGGLAQERGALIKFHLLQTAFQSRLLTGCFTNLGHTDVHSFLKDCQQSIKDKLGRIIKIHHMAKVNVVLHVDFQKVGGIVSTRHFTTKNHSIMRLTLFKPWFDRNILRPLLTALSEFETQESGWGQQSIRNLILNVNKYQAIHGSSYIKLPKAVSNIRGATVNVKNRGEDCFKYAVLAALFARPEDKNPHRRTYYDTIDHGLNFDCVQYPTPLRQIPIFERENNISVNVYVLEFERSTKRGKRKRDFIITPCVMTQNKRERHVHLLLIQEEYDTCDIETGEIVLNEYLESCVEDNNDDIEGRVSVNFEELFVEELPQPNQHYVAIKDLAKLAHKQVTLNRRRMSLCDRCLHIFTSAELLAEHERDCSLLNKARPIMPDESKKILYYRGHKKQERCPVVVYADLESILQPVNDDGENDNGNDAQRPNTYATDIHIPFSIGYYIRSDVEDGRLPSEYQTYTGPNPAKWFAARMKALAHNVADLIKHDVGIRMDDEDYTLFHGSNICHICSDVIKPKDKKVRDHCHLTGRFRGPAHSGCNILHQETLIIPIIFHNLSNYDLHFIIKDICICDPGETEVIASNMEKYIMVSKRFKGIKTRINLLDSYRFLASSLDTLASILPAFPLMRTAFPNVRQEDDFSLLTRKGVFPYKYLDCMEKLKETSLPPKDKFYSDLSVSHISDDEYAHAQEVWRRFNITTLGDYAALYLKGDTMILADVFENFRLQCITSYGLDPAQYPTIASYTWDCMLKYTGVRLELLTDIDMYMFVERGIRGGLSQCSFRHAKANNPFVPDFKETLPTSYLSYLDINNLYGWAMCESLPIGGFEWVPNTTDWMEEVKKSNGKVGFILEVDLDYPLELHDRHNDLPFCPESSIPPGGKQKKLLATLNRKNRYVVHYRALKQAQDHGLRVAHTHRILKFDQDAWLKSYVDFNTRKRQAATNDFEKCLIKLLVNAIFGKSIENTKKRCNIKLFTSWHGRAGAARYIANPLFKGRSIFDKNLVAVQLRQAKVHLNKPIYVGFSILDISKTCLYEFHYDIMTKILFNPNDVTLLYTDTDSLIYKVERSDFYDVIKTHAASYFDTSDFPSDNRFLIPQCNKKVVGKMKFEFPGKFLIEFVGLRPKSYAVRVGGEEENNGTEDYKKCKGIKTPVVKRTITFSDYLECLRHNRIFYRTQYNFRSRLHKVETFVQTKVALSPFDDKRYISTNNINTLAWGHKDVPFDVQSDINVNNDNSDDDNESDVASVG